MLIYWGVYFLLLILSWLSLYRVDRNCKFGAYILAFIVLFIFCGFRGSGIGFDYFSYKEIFFSIKNNIFTLIEPGFALLIKCISIFNSFNILLITVSFISIYIKLRFIWRYAPLPFVGLLIFYTTLFLINETGQIRYGLAISLVLVFFSCIYQEKKKCWMWLLAANTIHYSSLIVWPIFFFYKYNLSNKVLIAILIVCLSFYFIDINSILLMVSNAIPIEHVKAKVITLALDTDRYGKALGINFSLLMRIVILLGFRLLLQRQLVPSKWNLFFNLYFYGVIIYMVFNTNSEFAIRGSGYFKVLELIIIPYFVKAVSSIKKKNLVMILIYFYSGYSLWKIIGDKDFATDYIPYTNILFN